MIMNRFLRPILLWAGLASGFVYGQSINQAEYFLDEDPGLGNGVPIAVTPAGSIDQNFDVNTTGLSTGLHKIYVRSKQSDGLWGVPKTRFFYVSDPASQQAIEFATDIISAEYFFDTDPGPGQGASIPLQKASSIDQSWVAKTSGLDTGYHKLYIRTQSVDGFWSVPDTVSIRINDTACLSPVVDFTFDTVDIDTNVGLSDLSTNVDAGATYSWDVSNDGNIESTNVTFDTQFGSRGIYPIRLTITNPDGCSASIIKNVIVTDGLDQTLSLSASDSIISGELTTISAPAGYTYEWNTGATTQSIEVGEAGTYYCFLSKDGITVKSELVNISTFLPVTANLVTADATSGANNGAALLENITSDGLSYSISWSTGDTEVHSLTGLAPGSYSVTISTALDNYVFPFTIIDTTPANNSLVAAEFFIGTDPGPGNGTPISVYNAETFNINYSLDVSSLEIGLHKIYTRVQNVNGLWSVPAYRHFYVIDPNARIYEPFDFDLVKAEYFFDEDPGAGNGNSISITAGKTADVDFSHMISSLEGGLHEMYVRTQNSAGIWSLSRPVSFFVIGARFENVITFKTDIVEAEYFFNNDPGIGNGVNIPVQKSNQITNRPWAAKTDGLTTGEHTLNIRVKSQDGVWNVINTQEFTINEDACVPPIADFSFDTVGVETLVGITDLSAGLSDSVAYAWDIYGDGVIESTSPTFDTTFAEKGVYPLKLTVVNFPDSCFTSIVKDLYITDGFPNDLTVNNSDSLLVGDSIVYTAPEGFTYEWNTGDSTQSIAVKETGTYFAWLALDGISYKSKAETVHFFNPVTANLIVNQASIGVENGSARLTNIDSDGLPYQILWSTGEESTTNLSGLAIGNYQVEVATVLDTVQFTFAISEKSLEGTEVIAAEYFFNEDPGISNGTSIPIYQENEVDFDFSVDVSGLDVGLHKMYLRTQQASGLWGIPKTRFFYVIDTAQKVIEDFDFNLIGAEYYVDEDPGIGMAESIVFSASKTVDQPISLNTENLTSGLHFLYIRTQQDDGNWSIPSKTSFFVIDSTKQEVLFVNNDIVAGEYFFNEDPGVGRGMPLPIYKSDTIKNRPWSAATAGLETGKHKLYIRLQNQDGVWNMARQKEIFIYGSDCDLPNVDFTFDTVGLDTPIGLTDLSSNVLSGATYQWDIQGDGVIESNDPAYNPAFSEFGIYPIRLTIENAEGCSRSIVKDVLVVDQIPQAIAYSGGDSLLIGAAANLEAPLGDSYEWNTGDTTQTISVIEDGTYYAFVNSGGIPFQTNKLQFSFFDSLSFVLDIYPATSGLNNGAVIIDSLYSDGLPVSISWSSGEQAVFRLQELSSGDYSVTFTTPLQTVTESFTISSETAVQNSLIAYEYFVDTDPGPGLGIPVNGYHETQVSVDAAATFSDITEGTHNIYFRAKNEQGIWGAPAKKPFFILSGLNDLNLNFGGNIVYAEYAIDSLPKHGQGIPIDISASTSLDQTLAVDVSALSAGNHQLYVQVKDESGNWSMSETNEFTICNTTPASPVVNAISGCPGEDFVMTITNPETSINWYDSDSTLLQTGTSSSYYIYDVPEPTSYYVSQTNEEGCTSELVEVPIDIIEHEIFAGPDLDTYSYFDSVYLENNFPKGGSWSGSYVNADGLFLPKSAGIGTFSLTYTLDSAGCSLSDELLVNVQRLNNDAPIVEDQVFAISENITTGTILGKIIATDNEGDLIRYYGSSAADTSVISINELTGELMVKDSTYFDFESNISLDLNVIVSDPYYESTALITVNISDINEAPVITDQSFTLIENSPTNTAIGEVFATDPEGESLSYTITDGDADGAFSIDNSSGQITLADSSLIDFENTPSYELTVEVSDGVLVSQASVTITIENVNELPVVTDYTFSIAENSANGTALGTIVATDPEGEALAFSIESGNSAGIFTIDNSGSLTVSDSTALDYELGNNLINLSIAITDGVNQVTSTVEVTITPVNEAPIVQNADFVIDEMLPAETEVGTLVVSDPENDVLSFSFSEGNTSDAFAISTAGLITVNNADALEYDINPTFTLAIAVSDGDLSSTATVNVALNEVILNISESDSSALVALYDSTGGSGWTNNSGWLTEPIADWHGVNVDGPRILSIELANNNLTGKIPDQFMELSGVSILDFSNNELTNLPKTGLIPGVLSLDISNNRLQFGALEPLVQASTEIAYAPQKIVLQETRVIAELGTNATIDRSVSGTDNTYSWFKDGEAYPEGSGSEITVAAGSFSDEAVYFAKVTSSIVPELTLTTANVNFKVSSLERDRAALLAIYDALNGENWDNGSDWPSTDLNSWDEITITNNRVTAINLSDNNASGSVPADINDLLELTSIDLSNNQISGLPTITLPNLTSLNVSNNQLEFDDLEPNVEVTGINYSNQTLADSRLTEIISVGSDYTLNVSVGGESNQYTWIRSNDISSNVTLVENSSESSYTIENINYETMGSHVLTVTNPVVSGLTLTSKQKVVYASADLGLAAYDNDSAAFVDGEAYAFRVTQAGAYDTIQTVSANTINPNIFTFSDLILGDYLLAVRPDVIEPFFTTYYPSTDLWIEAEQFSLREDTTHALKMGQIPPPPPDNEDAGVVEGTVESEFEDDTTANGRILARKKVKRAACSMRRYTGSGRLMEDDSVFVLYAYLESDDEGRFKFEDIEAGRYRFNIEYPGIPMDPDSYVSFTIGDDGVEKNTFTLEAVITENGIVVEKIQELGFYRKYFKDLEVYPNPANDFMTISYAKLLHTGVTMRLVDLMGRTVLERQLDSGYDREMEIDVSKVPDGIYLVNFIDTLDRKESVISIRVSIQH